MDQNFPVGHQRRRRRRRRIRCGQEEVSKSCVEIKTVYRGGGPAHGRHRKDFLIHSEGTKKSCFGAPNKLMQSDPSRIELQRGKNAVLDARCPLWKALPLRLTRTDKSFSV